MENSKIFSILRYLSRQELREFGKFVRSPFHNNRRDVIRFYDVIVKSGNIIDESKEAIHKKMFPGKKYDSNSIILLSAYLYNLAREFLTIKKLKENKFYYRYFFLKGLEGHSADRLFEMEYRNTAESLDHERFNSEFFKSKGMLEELKIEYNLKRNRQDKTCEATVNWGNYHLYSFIVWLNIIYHDMVVNKSGFNFDYSGSGTDVFINNFNFEKFIDELQINDPAGRDFILYYYFVFMCNRYPENDSYYERLKDYSSKNTERIDESEKSLRFNFMLDYCMNRLKRGDTSFLNETFNLHTEALEKILYELYTKSSGMGLMFFRNFVSIGLAAKQYDYIENFIAQYGPQVKDKLKDDLLELSNAMLHFEKKEYDEALEHLNKVTNEFPLFRLSTKYLLVKIYYETNQFEAFYSLADTYRHYLKNEKIISDLIRKYHSNFLHYLVTLSKIKSSGTYDDVYLLKKDIKENEDMDFRHKLWLLEKTGELERAHVC